MCNHYFSKWHGWFFSVTEKEIFIITYVTANGLRVTTEINNVICRSIKMITVVIINYHFDFHFTNQSGWISKSAIGKNSFCSASIQSSEIHRGAIHLPFSKIIMKTFFHRLLFKFKFLPIFFPFSPNAPKLIQQC